MGAAATLPWVVSLLLVSSCGPAFDPGERPREAQGHAEAARGGYRCLLSRAVHGVTAVAAGADGVVLAGGAELRAVGADGREAWIFRADLDGAATFSAVAVDADGDVTAAARGDRGFTLTRLDREGRVRWSAFDARDAMLLHVAAGPRGDVVVTGRARFRGDKNAFALRYDADGQLAWSRSYPGETARAAGAAIGETGDVVVGGRFASRWDFGGGPLEPAGAGEHPDAFLVRYDASGRHLWSRRFGDERAQEIRHVAVGANGATAVLARNDGRMDFGGGPVGFGDAIAVLDAQGEHVWSRAFPGAVLAIGCDGAGAFTIVGQHAGAIDLGAGPLVDAAGAATYVARIDVDGRPLGGARVGGVEPLRVQDVAVGASGEVVLLARLDAAVDLGCGLLEPAGDADQIVVVLAPAER